MATELELKLAIAPADAAALKRHPLLAALRPTRRRMLNTYFDTPALDLAGKRMALRLRRAGGKWLQTLKSVGAVGAGSKAAAGLHRRDEWEYPLATGALDLAEFSGSALDAFKADKLAAQLRPVFTTDFMRTAWIIEAAPGTRIEVALDQGRISSGTREVIISEVELELIESEQASTGAGGAAALHDLAAQLQQQVKLCPDSVSKAERGYNLYRNEALRPAKFSAPKISATLTPHAALRLCVRACLAQMDTNMAGVLRQSRDSEFLHQVRVALRRMRAILKLAGQVDPSAGALADAIKPVAVTLGAARDWDVFIEESLPPLLRAWKGPGGNALLARARRRRTLAREAARQMLSAPPWCATLLALSRWLETPPVPGADSPALLPFAATYIGRRHKHLLRKSAGLATLPPEQRHRARIVAKKLRYGTESFAALFAAKPVRSYLGQLVVVQDALGLVNDSESASQLIAELATPAELALFAKGWFAGRDARELEAAVAALALLAQNKRFWKPWLPIRNRLETGTSRTSPADAPLKTTAGKS